MNLPMLICSNCNTPAPDNASFCAACGQPIKLNARYQIIEEIAKGSGSTVFKAHDTMRSNKEIIVKRFAPVNWDQQTLRAVEAQCKHEAEILNNLNHHSIPDVYDYFSARGAWYLVMKLVEGETLEARWQRARKKTRLSTEEILSIGDELCSILDYLHQRSIIFVDLKPSNIILGIDNHISLIDFGSAYDIKMDKHKIFKQRITIAYVAPEILQGNLSIRSDIYSLGVTLFQLVSGEKPSNTPSPSDILDNRKLAGTPPELAQLLARMIHEDEHNRPQGVTDVQKELRDIKQKLKLPVTSQNISTGRRNFLLGGLIGVILSLVGGTASWFAFLRKNVVQFPLTVGSKLDNEAVLLSEMYLILLQNAGFLMTDNSKEGKNEDVFNAIITRAIDIYPEFLQTGLAKLGLHTTHNQMTDFKNVKEGFFDQYQITWLDQATNLNDTFCLAMPMASANQLNIKTLSDLARHMQSQSQPLRIAAAPDYSETLNSLQNVYSMKFLPSQVTEYRETETFGAVTNNFADICICYSTDPLIAKDNFIVLIDDKKALALDTPSPIIRNDVLQRAPDIAKTLNRLAPYLSSSVSIQLQQQVLDGQSAHDVAEKWLKDQNLL